MHKITSGFTKTSNNKPNFPVPVPLMVDPGDPPQSLVVGRWEEEQARMEGEGLWTLVHKWGTIKKP